MKSAHLDDLAALVAVAEERSFTRAAAKLGISQSALSHAMRALEERVGVRLLARTTRSVATTEAGEALIQRLRPALGEVTAALDDLRELRTKPSGTVRITTMKHAAETVLEPAVAEFTKTYPDVTVEIIVDDRLTDIVTARCDAGVRFGEMVERDMIAVKIGGDLRFAVFASPEYLAAHGKPRTPQDLLKHRCINHRFATSGRIYAWEFSEGGRDFDVAVKGPLVVNDADLTIQAALDGVGIGMLFEDQVKEHLAAGTLVRLLAKWCEPFPGYFLYYAGRRQTPALTAFVETLRARTRRRNSSAR
jgi:DNA-binding transcriptional LysR family regulator